jgi:hypothetical protein
MHRRSPRRPDERRDATIPCGNAGVTLEISPPGRRVRRHGAGLVRRRSVAPIGCSVWGSIRSRPSRETRYARPDATCATGRG